MRTRFDEEGRGLTATPPQPPTPPVPPVPTPPPGQPGCGWFSAGDDQEVALPPGTTLMMPNIPPDRQYINRDVWWTPENLFDDNRIGYATATFPSTGTYVLTLTINEDGLVCSDTVTVKVVAGSPVEPPAPTPPPSPTPPPPTPGKLSVSIDANPSTIALSDLTTLASTIDGGSGSYRYNWFKVTGKGGVTFGTKTQPQTTAKFDTADTYIVRLAIKDLKSGAMASGDVEVVVQPDGTPPPITPPPPTPPPVTPPPVTPPPTVPPSLRASVTSSATAITLPQNTVIISGMVTGATGPVVLKWSLKTPPPTVPGAVVDFSPSDSPAQSGAPVTATFHDPGQYTLEFKASQFDRNTRMEYWAVNDVIILVRPSGSPNPPPPGPTPTPGQTTVTVSPTSARPRDIITIRISGLPAGRKTWAGIFAEGGPDNTCKIWKDLPPDDGTQSGYSFQAYAPTPPFGSDSWGWRVKVCTRNDDLHPNLCGTEVAKSDLFMVDKNAPPSPTPSPVPLPGGSPGDTPVSVAATASVGPSPTHVNLSGSLSGPGASFASVMWNVVYAPNGAVITWSINQDQLQADADVSIPGRYIFQLSSTIRGVAAGYGTVEVLVTNVGQEQYALTLATKTIPVGGTIIADVTIPSQYISQPHRLGVFGRSEQDIAKCKKWTMVPTNSQLPGQTRFRVRITCPACSQTPGPQTLRLYQDTQFTGAQADYDVQ